MWSARLSACIPSRNEDLGPQATGPLCCSSSQNSAAMFSKSEGRKHIEVLKSLVVGDHLQVGHQSRSAGAEDICRFCVSGPWETDSHVQMRGRCHTDMLNEKTQQC